MPEVRIAPVLDVSTLAKQVDTLAQLNVATIRALNEEDPSMAQSSPTAVAKAALDQAAFSRALTV